MQSAFASEFSFRDNIVSKNMERQMRKTNTLHPPLEVVLWHGTLTIEALDFGPMDVVHIDNIPRFACLDQGDALLTLRTLDGKRGTLVFLLEP